jgi:hypothetical protein
LNLSIAITDEIAKGGPAWPAPDPAIHAGSGHRLSQAHC